MIVNPVRSHLAVSMVMVDDYPHPRCYEPQAVILPLTIKVDGVTPRGGLCWFNCVEVCKATIGMKSFFTFTRYQLFKRLRRMS